MIILLLIIIVVILFFVRINSNKPNNISQTKPNTEKDQSPPPTSTPIRYRDFYKAKRYLITLTELNFYNVLSEVAKELNLVVFSQVSMYNIVETKDTPYRATAFNKIRSKSIDFVLTDTKSCRILLCIELNDYTHKYKKRIERDKFLEDLFLDLDIKFIQINPSNYYNKELLKNKIQNAIEQYSYK